MRCPNCQHENQPSAKFCQECATPLPTVCANCGSPLPESAKFCAQCAHPVAAPQALRDASCQIPGALTKGGMGQRVGGLAKQHEPMLEQFDSEPRQRRVFGHGRVAKARCAAVRRQPGVHDDRQVEIPVGHMPAENRTEHLVISHLVIEGMHHLANFLFSAEDVVWHLKFPFFWVWFAVAAHRARKKILLPDTKA